MREILFRGKRLDNGEWVEGYLYEHEPPLQCIVSKDYIPEPSRWYIIKTAFADWNMPRQVEFIEIDPDTVCQFTGLLDKNGKRIFEGDVVAQSWYDFDEPADDSFGEVVFSVSDCSFSVLDLNKNEIMSMGHGCAYHYEVEIIGNIHDNPELLGGGGSDG